MKIFLITSPPRNTLEFDMKNAHDMVIAIGNRYGIHVIDCYENCMINLQNFNQYSGDGTHLNAKGNAIWGKYIGENIKRFGEIFN
jgi:lysophospholipase L1-like esterase